MVLRVLETVEAHCGYHFPWSPSNFFPLYGGSDFHDYHHRLLYTKSGNYSSTFVYMNWLRALLTDSGDFQMVSLLHLADITEKGVTFQSPVDGKLMLLTLEESIQIQNRIKTDIIMALDDVVKTTITGPRIEEAMYLTLHWIDRCIAAHKRPHKQNLFGIVQGGLDPVLRDICIKGLVERNLPGYAIGRLADSEDKDSFWRVVAQCTGALLEDIPQYVMGVGY